MNKLLASSQLINEDTEAQRGVLTKLPRVFYSIYIYIYIWQASGKAETWSQSFLTVAPGPSPAQPWIFSKYAKTENFQEFYLIFFQENTYFTTFPKNSVDFHQTQVLPTSPCDYREQKNLSDLLTDKTKRNSRNTNFVTTE